MDKLLNAIASGLTIRGVVDEKLGKMLEGGLTITMQMFNYRDVEDEVKALFKKELNNHLFTKLQDLKVGEDVDYYFVNTSERPLGTLMAGVNDNLAEVLLKLPTLNDGETYVFLYNTHIGFILTERNEERVTVRINHESTWIAEAYK